MQASATKPWPQTVFSFHCEGIPLCYTAFQRLYGFSKNKWTAAKKYYVTSSSVPFHATSGNVRPSSELQNSCIWLALFIDSVGDRNPTDNSVHLPIFLSRKDMHSIMVQLQPDIPHLSFTAFCRMWKDYFSYVKLPKGCRLGKCVECISLTTARLRAHSEEEAEEFRKKRKQHLGLIWDERHDYCERAALAKANKGVYMSMIMDFSNPIPLPFKSPTPKTWIRYANRIPAMINGIINHGRTKKISVVVGSGWKKNSNLVISILFSHLKEMLASHYSQMDIITASSPSTVTPVALSPISMRPTTLYLQADNCWAENKNIYVFAFLCFLIKLDVFTDIYYNFLPTGHTHEDIDQLFSVLQTKSREKSIHTPTSLTHFLEAAYQTEESIPSVSHVDIVWNWKAWFSDHINHIQGHSKPHSFHFFKQDDGQPVIQNKDHSSIGSWSKPWSLLISTPTGTHTHYQHNLIHLLIISTTHS